MKKQRDWNNQTQFWKRKQPQSQSHGNEDHMVSEKEQRHESLD